MKKDIPKKQALPNIEAVFIQRESHLGFRAYALTIKDGEPSIAPIMKGADLKAIALHEATVYLGGERAKVSN